MELLEYYRLFRRWMWVVLLSAFVAGSFSFIRQINKPPLYRASTVMQIGTYLNSPNPNSQDIYTGIELARTYAEIVHTYGILNSTITALDLPMDESGLADLITVNIVSRTSLLEISVTHTDDFMAADIANTVAQQLILQSPTNLTVDQQNQVDLLNEEIQAQRFELQTLRERLAVIDASSNDANTTEENRTALQDQRNILVGQINVASSNIAQFTETIASFQSRTNSIEIIENARVPDKPIGNSLISSVILAIMVGGALSFGGILTYEYLNDTFRRADDVTRVLNIPVLGVISRFGKKVDTYNNRLISNLAPLSQTSEEYRTLRTNLMYTTSKDARVFLVSSASPGEGKSVTSANLAVSMALSGSRVLLIDADLRRPRVHLTFGLDNQVGLSSLLARRVQPAAKTSSFDDLEGQTEQLHDNNGSGQDLFKGEDWKKVMQKTTIPNLHVITSGFTPINPSELLGSALMRRWISEFRKARNIDAIILDSPPALALSDSTVLAASVDAKVLLVIQASKTRRSVVLKAKERFTSVNVEVVGAVLNGANLRDEEYYGYSYHYYYSDSQNPTFDSETNS